VPTHQDLILDQFTKQVVPFATAPGIKDEDALKLVVDFTGTKPDDTLLDVLVVPVLSFVPLPKRSSTPPVSILSRR